MVGLRQTSPNSPTAANNWFQLGRPADLKSPSAVWCSCAQRLGIDPRWLLLGEGHSEPLRSGSVPIRHVPLMTAIDLVNGCLNSKPQSRPLQLVSTVYGFPGSCFAMVCEDAGVSQNFGRGDLLIVDPQAKPSPDAYVVAVVLQDSGKNLERPQIVVRRIQYTAGVVHPREPVWLVADVAGWPSLLVNGSGRTGCWSSGRVSARNSLIRGLMT